MCLAFGQPTLDDVARKLETVIEMQPPQGLVEKVKGLGKLKRLADSLPKKVRSGPSQEIVMEPDLDVLPIQHCWPGDPAPFITLPAVITKDPRTGSRNVGMYRMQKIDARRRHHWQIHKDGRPTGAACGERLEVAVELGLDPVTAYSASAPPRAHRRVHAGRLLRGEPVELVKAKTVDLEVPANAEIILKGDIQKGELGMEGPFGDHTGYYRRRSRFRFSTSLRHDAPGRDLPVDRRGRAPGRGRLARESDRAHLPACDPDDRPGDRRLRPTCSGAFHNCVVVSIRKAFPGHARKVMYAIWGLGMLSLSKSVVVVDEFVDVHDFDQVFFHVCANVDPKRDVVLTEGPLDQLDHAAAMHCYGGKIGIDATHKWESEGARPWPGRIVMRDDIRDIVDRRWDEYGITLSPPENGRIPGDLRQPLRR